MAIDIICDYEIRPEWRVPERKRPLLLLSTDSARGNVYLEPAKLEKSLGVALDPLSLDLCEIAAYVYLADKAVARGRYEKWVRDLSFLIPVRMPSRWNAARKLLTNTVGTLSGDNVRFRFVKKDNRKRKPVNVGKAPQQKAGDPDCVSLFSGGLDSFAGAQHLVLQGRRPLLASHYASGLKGLQKSLVESLEAALDHSFDHFQYYVTKRRGRSLTLRESSHRARSFLFMSFATVAAAVRGLSDIYIPENGVLSLNVPISEARKGTRSTRHAHPLYLRYFNELIDCLYRRKFSVRNPFFYLTKRDEVDLVDSAGQRSLIRDTVSCWGYPNLTIRHKGSNHCGTCIPCLVRRVAMIAAGLERYDDRYVVDVFDSGSELNAKDRRNVEDLVYFCECFETSTKTELLYRYPELVMVESSLDKTAGSRIDTMIGVYRRFARDVLAIAEVRAPDLLRKRQAA